MPAIEGLRYSEKTVIARLGFMLNAYKVQWYWWEVFETLRKQILTSILVVFSSHIWNQSDAHVAFSMLTSIFFWGLVLKLEPYQDKHLNDFQGCALLSHILTIFSCWCWLGLQRADDLQPYSRKQGHHEASTAMGYVIIVCDVLAIMIVPLYR